MLFPNILIIYRAIIGSLCTVDDGATYRSNGIIRKNFIAISIFLAVPYLSEAKGKTGSPDSMP